MREKFMVYFKTWSSY